MKVPASFLRLSFVIFFVGYSAYADFATWAKIKTPLPGPARPIGFYSAGCLGGAVKLPQDGDNYAVMRLSRNRFWGHPDLIEYLNSLSSDLKSQKVGLMMVGDMSPPRGGPMKSGHASHQSGLDVDIWLNTNKKRPTRKQRETWSAISYVKGRKVLLPSWGTTQTKLMVTAANNDRVERVFISAPIKKFLCEQFPNAPWLYRVRPWWGHTEHLHVRLKCPVGDASCTPQDPLNPADSGCGEDLAWWFSAEADEEWKKIVSDPTPRQFPELPEACGEMVK